MSAFEFSVALLNCVGFVKADSDTRGSPSIFHKDLDFSLATVNDFDVLLKKRKEVKQRPKGK
jgi:hypothetical protein